MTAPFLESEYPRVFAHRGLAIDAPENTLLAFKRAIQAGATHLETDVHASRDGVAVISHDPDLRRLVGRDARVGDLTLDELHSIDLGHAQSFCSLAEALGAFPAARFNIDVKDDAAIGPTAAAVAAAAATDRVLITSFSEHRRSGTVQLLPGVASSASSLVVVRAVLAAKLGWRAELRQALNGLVALQIPERRFGLPLVTRRVVDAVHRAGAEVHVWTVNDPAAMERLFSLGVDGIVTDRSDLAVAVARADPRHRSSPATP
ncbi:glycerophosphodiester phosphodiesterase family protein [Rathayibacter sp. YIM 133350]|uniref:glycerophosphodiester phosphodiesterase family protein n=1 Tax=Rathayibacter sp. YIM 133350 TaxID=3131992 RepID=UPI00307D84B6